MSGVIISEKYGVKRIDALPTTPDFLIRVAMQFVMPRQCRYLATV